MTGFEVNPDSLRGGGRAVASVADRFSGQLEAFESRMEGFGEPWGGDDIGMLIGIAYTEIAEYAFECFQLAADELTSAADDLTAMADGYEQVDDEAAAGFSDLSGQLG